MDKKNIPVTIVTIGKGKTKQDVRVYEYLTAGEQAEKERILHGTSIYSLREMGEGKEIDVFISIDQAIRIKELHVKALLVDLKPEDIDVMVPELRNQLYQELANIAQGVKKK